MVVVDRVPRAEVAIEHVERVGIASRLDLLAQFHQPLAALAQVNLVHVAAGLDQQVDHLPLLIGQIGCVGRHIDIGNRRAAGQHVIPANFAGLLGRRRAGGEQRDRRGGQ